MNDWAESNLAWELADAISPLLADRDRAQLYTTIGAGLSYTAIDMLLQTIAHQGFPLACEFIAELGNWLSAYAHTDDARRLNELLERIRSCHSAQPEF